MKTILRLSGLGALWLAASCASDGSSVVGGGSANYAAGSSLAREMSSRDEAVLARTFVQAVEEGAAGEGAVWSSGNFAGSVTPGAYLVANLKPDDRTMLPVAAPLTFNESYETELGMYALTGKANLRAGPSTGARVLGQLESGTGVDVVGKVSGKPWMLVAIDGEIRGYVHESLMIRAPGDDLTLAGGPTRRAKLCRAFEQRLTLFGRTERWSGVACKDDGEWRLEGPAQVVAG
jgi:hypothetical protein